MLILRLTPAVIDHFIDYDRYPQLFHWILPTRCDYQSHCTEGEANELRASKPMTPPGTSGAQKGAGFTARRVHLPHEYLAAGSDSVLLSDLVVTSHGCLFRFHF